MKYIQRFFYVSIISLIFFSCASENRAIKKLYSFYTVTTPGNIPVDRNGNALYRGPDTLNIVYVEVHGKEPEWQYAWQHNRLYKIRPVLVRENEVSVGKYKTTEQTIMVHATETNKLYQLVFEPSPDKIPSPESIEQTEILLQGKYKGKTFRKKISDMVELYQRPTE